MKNKAIIFSVVAFSNTAAALNIIPVGLREATIQDIVTIFYGITAAAGVLMIVFQGIKWITSDNDEDRKQAKQGIIHVIAGLLLILIAAALVEMVYTKPSY